MTAALPPPEPAAIERFIARWQDASGSERANYQLFIGELTELLGLPRPDPAREDTRDNIYVFERRVTFQYGDGAESSGFIDCYRRGAFVLEAKKVRANAGKGFDDALQRARGQAEAYARALPAQEGRPPFLVVVDVGNVIELYAEFTRSGATYTPFPDPRSHRIGLADLRNVAARERLARVWLDPLALDPSRATAKVTREVAGKLAEAAKALEKAGHAAEDVAGFLTRCLFSMFAEDVGLLPPRAFSVLLESLVETPAQFVPLIGELWRAMDKGDFSAAIRAALPRFNGKLFKDPTVLPLTREQIELLIAAAKADWTQVEPAIFGTLLERALNPSERHALGAHYTPRAYVERLVLPTVVEPLRQDWANVQAAALLLAGEGKPKDAVSIIRTFHHRLCETRVLDPACGSGNFLYVTLEHMKRLEGEVLNQLHALGESQTLLEAEGLTVDPHQFLGLELNPRAAAIAELVLWIGYLQWHFRTKGAGLPPQPVLKDFRNIECRDAVLAYDRIEYVMNAAGLPVSRWDGKTMKPHAVTGKDVPDERAQVPLERYVNPRPAEWPRADYVVGNPPYLGARTIRAALGDGYLAALRCIYVEVPDHADYVMYWWAKAAQLTIDGQISRFGLITTKSLSQEFSRKVVQHYQEMTPTFGYRFAIPNHPWVDASDGADVRVALTVCDNQGGGGQLMSVVSEAPIGDGEIAIEVKFQNGQIGPDLGVGINTLSATPLRANAGLCSVGYQLSGQGFVVDERQAHTLDHNFGTSRSQIWPLVTGRDITQQTRGLFAIDVCAWNSDELRINSPPIFQWLLDRVKPERDHNNRASVRDRWWIFGEARNTFRPALAALPRVIVTSLTAKYRFFQFVHGRTICDSTTVMFALPDAMHLAILSSHAHIVWALHAGGRLGVGDDPRYLKARCFDTFPFPVATPEQQAHIRALAEELDAHRKRQQAAHAELTLTGMYNVLEKLNAGATLTAKEKTLHELGLVSVLKSLHDELDGAVLAAYGWSDLAPLLPDAAAFADAVLARLVALNAERAAEEARGQIRWLRPAFQAPAPEPHQTSFADDAGLEASTGAASRGASATSAIPRAPWPATLPEQVAAVARVLAEARAPLAEAELAARFTGKGPWKKRLPQLLDTLVALGRARALEDGRWMG